MAKVFVLEHRVVCSPGKKASYKWCANYEGNGRVTAFDNEADAKTALDNLQKGYYRIATYKRK